jgi:hypothetical protein
MLGVILNQTRRFCIMSNDISSMYTKDQNKKAGRRGYLSWKHEKVTIIPPAAYGDYILQDRRRGKKK